VRGENERTVDQRVDDVDRIGRGESHVVAHRQCGVEIEATGEDRHPPEDLLILLRQKLVRPVDRGRQGPLSRHGGAVRSEEGKRRAIQQVEELGRRHATDACRHELHGERDAVEALADRTNGVELRASRLPTGTHRSPAFDEQLDRGSRTTVDGGDIEARHSNHRLAADGERSARRGEHPHR